jgi:PKD repeat protein
MTKEKRNIDKLFRMGFEDHAITPSESLLKKIRFKLWLTDFLSFNFKVFNFIYALTLISGLSFSARFIVSQHKESLTEENLHSLTAEPDIIDTSTVNSEMIEPDLEINAENTISTENLLPALSFIPSVTQGCTPLTVVFKNTSKNADDFFWNFGNGKTSSEKNPKIQFSEAGQYTVTLTATNSKGLQNTLKQTIIAYSNPTAIAEIDISESDIKTKKVAFINKSENAGTFFWNFGDNTTSTKVNAEHIYKRNGKFKVTLIAYSQYGCTDTTFIENSFIEKNYEMSFPPKFRPGTYNSQNSGFYENAAEQNFIFFPLNNGAHNYELRIFAPNGIEVFKTTNVKQGWNGFIKGRVAPPGRYTFTAKGVYPNGKRFEIKSSVDVIVDEVNGYY